MKLDFGSGYNPKKEYKTCDIYGYVDYYFDPNEYKILDLGDNSIDHIRCRNVLHHIKDIDKLSKEFFRVLKQKGTLEIIDVNEDYYSQNYYLDYLWYRWVIPRKEIWFCNKYRNLKPYFNNFKLKKETIENEKIILILEK